MTRLMRSGRWIRRSLPFTMQRCSKTTLAFDRCKIGLLFPGQGAQRVGMGKDIYETFPSAMAVFEEAEDALQIRLRPLIFEGPQETLTLTENAQPAILTTSLAILRVLERDFGFSVAERTSFALGHSLGEYTALVAAGSLSLADAVCLVRARGLAMSETVRDHIRVPIAMAALAVRRHQLETLEAAMVDRVPAALYPGEHVDLANVNASFQVVLSGTAAGVDRAAQLLQEWGLAARAIDLPISVPSHSSLLAPAAKQLAPIIRQTNFKAPTVPVIANVTARPHGPPDTIADTLITQVTGRVMWHQSIDFCRHTAATHHWLSFGPGAVLHNLLRKEHPLDHVRSIQTPHDIEAVAKLLNL